MQLLDVKQGKTVKIIKFGSTLSYKRRLVGMGVRIGSVVKILTKNKNNTIIIGIEGVRYILGADMVKYIEVEDD